ncbi:MAG TPA: TonB-dependent receptor, partial [bacterium]
LTYGTEFTHDEESATRNGGVLPVFPDATATRAGAYIQDELKAGRWRITPGVRYDTFTTKAQSVAGTNENHHVSPKLGAVYTATPNLNLHALYAQGFRAPSIQELYISGLHFGGSPTGIFVPNPDLKPELSVNTEAGFTHKGGGWFDKHDRTLVRVAIFRNDVSQFIDFAVFPVGFNQSDSGVTCTNGGGCLFFKPVNVQRARLTGDEIEASYTAPVWRATLAFSQIRGIDADSGDPLDSMPADKLVLTLQRAFQGGDWWVGGRRTQVEAQDRVTDPSLETPGYVLLDALVTYEPMGARWRGLRVDMGVDNIMDVSYRRHLSPLKEAGRNYKTTVTYRF